ncbi:MAG TPA: LON peptidase substrate-binding domain-containing protein [Gemmatimonadales bacterium]|nr:LON peptidase substrate-binding domain-containing protein [Gemmatimonadales bacterium]
MSPYRLPLFPLTVVLFPGTALPLHLFEPRYRRLLDDCLSGSRRFGITPTGTQREAPDPGTVGCVAEVRANERLPDGRSNVLVLGGTRFVVRQVVPDPAPYYMGLVDEFEEDPATLPGADAVRELRDRFVEYHRAVRLLNDSEPDEPSLPETPLPLSFAVAAAVECDAELKQRLLATRSTSDRVHLLLRLLPGLTARVEAALQVHRRAHGNGKGGAYFVLPPDV